MKKVILYGIRGSGRKEIEYYLSDEYEIVGYSDSDMEYQQYQWVDYKRFYKKSELKNAEFDYCIITSKSRKTTEEIKSAIVEFVDINKIIEYALFWEVQYPHPYEVFKRIDIQQKISFQGYIFGMSHAYRGIDINAFHEPVFNFASSSNDLFFHYHLLNKMCKKGQLNNIKWCMLEIPYYIFNWDRSLSKSMERCLNSYTLLEGEENQYHHIGSKDVINKYHIYKNMFKKKRMQNISVTHCGAYAVQNVICDGRKMEMSNVWKYEHENTIHENIAYFKEILRLLHNKNIKVYVVVFPQNPYFYHQYEAVIQKAKEKFYHILMPLRKNVEIWDFFRFYEEYRDYFEDDCHLNINGKNYFTKELVKRVEEDNDASDNMGNESRCCKGI